MGIGKTPADTLRVPRPRSSCSNPPPPAICAHPLQPTHLPPSPRHHATRTTFSIQTTRILFVLEVHNSSRSCPSTICSLFSLRACSLPGLSTPSLRTLTRPLTRCAQRCQLHSSRAGEPVVIGVILRQTRVAWTRRGRRFTRQLALLQQQQSLGCSSPSARQKPGWVGISCSYSTARTRGYLFLAR